MAVTLRLQLENADATYKLDSSIRGHVLVGVDESTGGSILMELQALTVAALGPERLEIVSGEALRVFEGNFAPGKDNTFPFELPTPSSPPSYIGEVLGLVWQVKVRVDLEGHKEPTRGVIPVAINARDDDFTEVRLVHDFSPEKLNYRPAGEIAITLGFLLVGGAAVAYGVSASILWLMIVAGFLTATTLFVLVGTIKKYQERGVVGNVRVDIASTQAQLPWHEITLLTLPTAPVAHAQLDIWVEEYCEVGREGQKQSRNVRGWMRSIPLAQQSAGEFSGRFDVSRPDLAPPSLRGFTRSLLWTAEAVLVDSEGTVLSRKNIPITAGLKHRKADSTLAAKP